VTGRVFERVTVAAENGVSCFGRYVHSHRRKLPLCTNVIEPASQGTAASHLDLQSPFILSVDKSTAYNKSKEDKGCIFGNGHCAKEPQREA